MSSSASRLLWIDSSKRVVFTITFALALGATSALNPDIEQGHDELAIFYDFDKTLINGTLWTTMMRHKSIHWFTDKDDIVADLAKNKTLEIVPGVLDSIRRMRQQGVKIYVMTYGSVEYVDIFLRNVPEKDARSLFDGIYGSEEGQNIRALTDDSVPPEDVHFGIADWIKTGFYTSGGVTDGTLGNPGQGPYEQSSYVGWAKWQRCLYLMRRMNIGHAMLCDDDKWNAGLYSNWHFGDGSWSAEQCIAEQKRLGLQLIGQNVPDNSDGKWSKEAERNVDSWKKEQSLLAFRKDDLIQK